MTKKYAVVNRKTFKVPSIKFRTREEARQWKREKDFRYAIVNLETNEVVR